MAGATETDSGSDTITIIDPGIDAAITTASGAGAASNNSGATSTAPRGA
jgi:hypothetical protein